MKTGLVLEGGGMRGIYTVGVLDVLMEHDLYPDYIVGVSAGACNGMSYASGQKGRGYRVIMNYIGDKRYVGLSNLIKTKSMFGMDFIFDLIPNQLDLFDYDAFQNSRFEFKTGATDAVTGKPVYFGKKYLDHKFTILRASSSIPVFAPVVEFEGGKYLDGGTADPIPVRQALEDGCDRVIVVLTQDRNFVKPPEKYRALYRRILKPYPEMIRVLDERSRVYNQTLQYVKQLEKDGTAVVVAPHCPLGISRFEKGHDKLEEIYQIGVQDGKAALTQMRPLLKEGRV